MIQWRPSSSFPAVVVCLLWSSSAVAQRPTQKDNVHKSAKLVNESVIGSDSQLRSGGRFRFAFALGGGPLVGDVDGAVGGLYVQLGWQLSSALAIYYQPTALIGAFLLSDITDARAALWNQLMADVTFSDHFQVGFGPSLDLATGCSASLSEVAFEKSRGGCADRPAFFGLNARAAAVIGGGTSRRRGGFLVAVDVHHTFGEYDTGLTAAFFSLGGVMY